MNSPLMNWLSKARPRNKPYNPNANAIPLASGFMDFMQRNGARWNPQPRQQAPVTQPLGQQAPAPQPMAAPVRQPLTARQQLLGRDYMPGSTGPGDSPDVGVEGISENGLAQGLHTAMGLAMPGVAGMVGGIGKGINATGLNQLSMMGVEPQLSTNHAGNDVAAHNMSVDIGMVGRDSLSTAANAVSDGTSSGSQSGQAGTGADGSGGNMGDPGGEGNGGTYRKGGYIPKDKDKKLEARKVTAHEGEFVLRPEAVKAVGSPFLHWLNARR
jgi:hypothetical protein